MKEHLGKYCLDLSKLVFGGAIISAIMKESISLFWIIPLGGMVVAILALAGFLLMKKINNYGFIGFIWYGRVVWHRRYYLYPC
jgi:hypothetical protein